MVGSPASRLTKLQEPPAPLPCSQSPNSRASVCTQKKVNIVQSKGRESPRLPRGAPCVSCSPVPSRCGEASPRERRAGPNRSGADPCVWTGTPHPPAHRQTLHLEQGTAASPALHAASGSLQEAGLAPGINRRQVKSKRHGGRAPPAGAAPQPPAASGTGRGVHRRGLTLGANTSSNNGSFPPPGQRSWAGQHTSMHPQTPRPLPTRQCHAGALQSAVGSVGAGGGCRRGQGWAVPPGPGLATGRQPILRMECRATVQQPRSSELML